VNQQPYVQHQPQPQMQLTPAEQEQLQGVQKWAEIREERRLAAGLSADGHGEWEPAYLYAFHSAFELRRVYEE